MPGLPNKRSEIDGEISFYGLAEWWLSTFTRTERIHIEERYNPLLQAEVIRQLQDLGSPQAK